MPNNEDVIDVVTFSEPVMMVLPFTSNFAFGTDVSIPRLVPSSYKKLLDEIAFAPEILTSRLVPEMVNAAPLDPLDPVDPLVPVEPLEPVDPLVPLVPLLPVDPLVPLEPVDPLVPLLPVVPDDPLVPLLPLVPVDPLVPVVPLVPLALNE